jgi:hypothetical protein
MPFLQASWLPMDKREAWCWQINSDEVYLRLCRIWCTMESRRVRGRHLIHFQRKRRRAGETTAGMYRLLLYQLQTIFPDLLEKFDLPAQDISSYRGSYRWGDDHSLGSPRDHFLKAITNLGKSRVFCFIDTLDECNDDEIRDMVNDFQDLGNSAGQSTYRLCTCFSSRHYPYIDIEYGTKIILEDQTGHLGDIEKYLQRRLRSKNEKHIIEIRIEVVQRAAGIFMWAVLVVSILNQVINRGRVWN